MVTEDIPFYVYGAVSNQKYRLVLKTSTGGTIVSFKQLSESQVTPGTYTVKINSTDVSGLAGIANSTSLTETVATGNNTYATGDEISVTLSGTASMVGFYGTLKVLRPVQ